MLQTRVKVEYGKATFKAHETEGLRPTATLAFQLIERWGMVAATPDGEDGAQRQKMRLLTVDEVVTRAFDAAEAALAEAARRGHTFQIPTMEELEAAEKADADAREAKKIDAMRAKTPA